MKNLNKKIQWIFKDKYGEKWNPDIIDDVRHLKAGEPVDYIIGWKPFLNCKIELSHKPLIPRPETEFWTEKAVKELSHFSRVNSRPLKIADVFSGSGCVGIAILKNTENSKVDFFEIEAEMIKQIKLNLKINRIGKSRYNIFHSDIFTGEKKRHMGKYDLILANPPYIAAEKKNKVQENVLKYEPKKALFGGKDGLFFIKKFLKQAQNHLNCSANRQSQIWMEFDSFQKPRIDALLKKLRYKEWDFQKDQYGKWRYVKVS